MSNEKDINNLNLGFLEIFPEEFLKYTISNSYKKKQVIFYEGNVPFGLYFIKEGAVKLYKTNSEGKVLISRLIKKGDILGYRAFFSNEPYNGTAETIEDSVIAFIDKSMVTNLLKKHSGLCLKLIEKFGNDLKSAEIKSANIAYKSINERMVELLLSLEESYGKVQEDKSIKLEINLSRDEIANMIGTTKESAVRILTRLKEKKILRLENKTISIIDLESLKVMFYDYFN